MNKMKKDGVLKEIPLNDYVAAMSVGIVKGEPLLDLNYDEDSAAEVDMNIVMTGSGRFIEVQGTAEKDPFSKEQMTKLMALAEEGIGKVISIQKKALKGVFSK
jgi:ribonuclease PH